MAKTNETLKVFTANRLREGDVVYLTGTGDWSTRLDEAAVITAPDETERAEAFAERAVTERIIVGPYLMKVARDTEREGALRPLSQREFIRAQGPSLRSLTGAPANGV